MKERNGRKSVQRYIDKTFHTIRRKSTVLTGNLFTVLFAGMTAGGAGVVAIRGLYMRTPPGYVIDTLVAWPTCTTFTIIYSQTFYSLINQSLSHSD